MPHIPWGSCTLSEGEFPSVRVEGRLSCPVVEYHPENLSEFSSEPLFENPSKYTSKRNQCSTFPSIRTWTQVTILSSTWMAINLSTRVKSLPDASVIVLSRNQSFSNPTNPILPKHCYTKLNLTAYAFNSWALCALWMPEGNNVLTSQKPIWCYQSPSVPIKPNCICSWIAEHCMLTRMPHRGYPEFLWPNPMLQKTVTVRIESRCRRSW